MSINNLEKIINQLKNEAKAKFDENIDGVFKLDMNPQKENVRSSVVLPHGLAKKVKICVFSSETTFTGTNVIVGGLELIGEIKKGKKLDFDICLTDPKFFAQVVPIAKILSQEKLMPSAKDGTVTNDIQKTINDIESGKKLNFKNDASGYIQTKLGKVSHSNDQIIENITTVIKNIKTFNKIEKNKNFIQSFKLNTTMGKTSLLVPLNTTSK